MEQYAFLHPLSNAEAREVKTALGLEHLNDQYFLETYRLEGDDAAATGAAKGKLGEIARIVRKYLPEDVAKEEYRQGTKAWLHFRARLNMRYHFELSRNDLNVYLHIPGGETYTLWYQNIYRARIVREVCNYLIHRQSMGIPSHIQAEIDRAHNSIPASTRRYIPKQWKPIIANYLETHFMNLD